MSLNLQTPGKLSIDLLPESLVIAHETEASTKMRSLKLVVVVVAGCWCGGGAETNDSSNKSKLSAAMIRNRKVPFQASKWSLIVNLMICA